MASAKIADQRPLNSPNIFHTVGRAGQRGAAQRRPQINSYAPPAPQAVVPGVLMQFVAEFIELPMAPPSSRAAMAMPVPTMARMSAYSAAEAPDSSFSILIRVFIIVPSLGVHRAIARSSPERMRKVAERQRRRARGYAKLSPHSAPSNCPPRPLG